MNGLVSVACCISRMDRRRVCGCACRCRANGAAAKAAWRRARASKAYGIAVRVRAPCLATLLCLHVCALTYYYSLYTPPPLVPLALYAAKACEYLRAVFIPAPRALVPSARLKSRRAALRMVSWRRGASLPLCGHYRRCCVERSDCRRATAAGRTRRAGLKDGGWQNGGGNTDKDGQQPLYYGYASGGSAM